jgi:hypothetical protein
VGKAIAQQVLGIVFSNGEGEPGGQGSVMGKFVNCAVERKRGGEEGTSGHGPDDAGARGACTPAGREEVKSLAFFCKQVEGGTAGGVLENEKGWCGGGGGADGGEGGRGSAVEERVEEGAIEGIVELSETGFKVCVCDARGKVHFKKEDGEGGHLLNQAQPLQDGDGSRTVLEGAADSGDLAQFDDAVRIGWGTGGLNKLLGGKTLAKQGRGDRGGCGSGRRGSRRGRHWGGGGGSAKGGEDGRRGKVGERGVKLVERVVLPCPLRVSDGLDKYVISGERRKRRTIGDGPSREGDEYGVGAKVRIGFLAAGGPW